MASTGNSIPGGPNRVPSQPRTVPNAPVKVPKTGSLIGTGLGGTDSFTLTAGALSMKWVGFVTLQSKMKAYTERFIELRQKICQELAIEMEAWAKENAPWEDRTGNARRTLKGAYVPNDENGRSSATITNQATEARAGGEHPYAAFLELSNGGVNAIVFPTIIHFAEIMLQRVAEAEATLI